MVNFCILFLFVPVFTVINPLNKRVKSSVDLQLLNASWVRYSENFPQMASSTHLQPRACFLPPAIKWTSLTQVVIWAQQQYASCHLDLVNNQTKHSSEIIDNETSQGWEPKKKQGLYWKKGTEHIKRLWFQFKCKDCLVFW